LRVAQAAPDGYNIVLGTVGTHAQNQTLYKRPLYNAIADFAPVALVAEVPTVLIVRKDLPVSNLKEFVAYAKKNQEKMSFGSAGAGSATHLACVILDVAMGTHITHVPYRGTGPAMQDLQAGRIDYLCEIVTTAKAQIDGNTVKAIALMNGTRSPALPNVPTTVEQGLANAEAYTWNAIFLPKNAPDAIVKKLNDATLQAMHNGLVKERLEGLGAQIVPDDRATPAYLGNVVKSEIEKCAGPIKASGATADWQPRPPRGGGALLRARWGTWAGSRIPPLPGRRSAALPEDGGTKKASCIMFDNFARREIATSGARIVTVHGGS